MQLKLLLYVFAVATVTNAVPLANDDDDLKEFLRVDEIADEDSQMHDVSSGDDTDEDLLEEIENNPDGLLYLLFTRRNPTNAQPLVVESVNSIINSFFDPSKPLMVIVHGWLMSQNNEMNPMIRDAYLRREDANVIVVDWQRLANSNYVTASLGVPTIGRHLSQFLQFLHRVTNAPFATMHLVGFNLGAHLVGKAGRDLRGQVARITGLDPAGPLWTVNHNRLGPNDGVYVEAIHTNGEDEGLGIGIALADVDFYPNGGNQQPGCLTPICHHNRSWRLFASTVTNDHLVGRGCDNAIQIALNLCRGEELRMGNSDLGKYGSGRFRVNTGRWYPY